MAQCRVDKRSIYLSLFAPPARPIYVDRSLQCDCLGSSSGIGQMSTRTRRQRIRDLHELLRWPRRLLQTVIDVVPPHILQRSLLAKHFEFSTQFSGMGTAETAMKIICAEAARMGLNSSSTHTSSCDSDKFCQKLLPQVSPGACVFADICGFVRVRRKMGNTAAKKVNAIRGGTLRKTAHCTAHGQQCPVRLGDVMIGGSPCIDFSTIGKRKRTEGTTLVPTLCWFKSTVGSKIWIHENVNGFEPSIPRMILPKSTIIKFETTTHDVGYGHQTRRRRTYRVGLGADAKKVLRVNN